MKSYYRSIIKAYRKKLTKGQRAASRRKSLRPGLLGYPFKAERQVFAQIRNMFNASTKRILTFIEAKYPKYFNKRSDDFATEFELFLRELEKEFSTERLNATLQTDFRSTMSRISNFIRQYSEKEVQDYLESVLGSSFYGTDEWWAELENAWLENSIARTSGSISDFYESVRRETLKAVREEIPFEDFLQKVQKLDTSLTITRATFIARDLTGKLNGAVERKLQMGLGISTYFWQTMADERVRGRPGGRYPDAIPSHWAIDSRVCSWTDASIYSTDYGKTWVPRLANMPLTHPGGDWQCRCRGTPFLADLLQEIDKEIEGESMYGSI